MKSLVYLSLLGVLGAAAGQVLASPLPALQADTKKISVSGLSSGAAMTTQLGVAYSDRIEAVGIMAGPPYLCAEGSSMTAMASCLIMQADMAGISIDTINRSRRDNIDLPNLLKDTRAFSAAGSIANVSNIAKQRVWVFRGEKDAVVGPNATRAVRDFYSTFKAQVAPDSPAPVPHTLATDKTDLGACDGTDVDYVSSCKLDNVGRMFGYLYQWPASERGVAVPGNLTTFDQGDYTVSNTGKKLAPKKLSMADSARVYVPTACKAGGCKVHVAIHGCKQGTDEAFDRFSREGGYNDWAESHRLIVLYPRAVASDFPQNPEGCWDWWGYAPDDRIDWRAYAKRDAAQMRSIMNMVDALKAKPAMK